MAINIAGKQGAFVIFIIIFVWLALQLVGLTLFAIWTYPTVAEAQLLTPAGENVADTLVTLRKDWQTSTIAIGTNLAITPMTTLLSAVVGYMLAKTQTKAE